MECYGGGLWHTWFDRDLTLAGIGLIDLYVVMPVIGQLSPFIVLKFANTFNWLTPVFRLCNFGQSKRRF